MLDWLFFFVFFLRGIKRSGTEVFHETPPEHRTDWSTPLFFFFYIIALFSFALNHKLSLLPLSCFQTVALNLFTWTSLVVQQRSTSSVMYCSRVSIRLWCIKLTANWQKRAHTSTVHIHRSEKSGPGSVKNHNSRSCSNIFSWCL